MTKFEEKLLSWSLFGFAVGCMLLVWIARCDAQLIPPNAWHWLLDSSQTNISHYEIGNQQQTPVVTIPAAKVTPLGPVGPMTEYVDGSPIAQPEGYYLRACISPDQAVRSAWSNPFPTRTSTPTITQTAAPTDTPTLAPTVTNTIAPTATRTPIQTPKAPVVL